MLVTIRISKLLSAYSRDPASFSLAAGSVLAALDELERTRPELHRSICDETGAVRRHVNLFVNGKDIRSLQRLDTPLGTGDVLTIVQAVSGG